MGDPIPRSETRPHAQFSPGRQNQTLGESANRSLCPRESKNLADGGANLFVRPGGQEELDAEITDEIRLSAARRFQTAPGHEQQDHWSMDLVASAKINRGLGLGNMEGPQSIKLHVDLQLRGEVMAHDQASEPAVGTVMHKLIPDFVIHIDGTKFLREFGRQFETVIGGADPALDGVVGIVEESLGKHRDGKAGLTSVVEAPLEPRIGLSQTEFCLGKGILYPQPRIFISKLDAIPESEVDIHIRDVRHGMAAVVKGHVTEIDFPIEIARGSWIIRVVGRPALGKCAGRRHQEEEKDQ